MEKHLDFSKLFFIAAPIAALAIGILLWQIFSQDETNLGLWENGSTVVDSVHKLEWQRCSVGQTWGGENCEGEAIRLNYESALLETKRPQNSPDLKGNGWRLPSRQELTSIVCIHCKGPKINRLIFKATVGGTYWTGEKSFWEGRGIWTVNFLTGKAYGNQSSRALNYIRLVRDVD